MKQEEILIRTPSSFGNGAHIFVPKYWLGSQITLIKPTLKSVKEKIIELVEPYLDSVLGVYLCGSHARNEQREGSDIDLLIITDKKLKIKAEGFEVHCIEEMVFEKALSLEPVLIYSLLSEAKPIINSKLLETLKKKHKPEISEFKKFIKESRAFYEINKEAIGSEKGEYYSGEAVIYSLVLRLRGIFIINSLLSGKAYSNKEFLAYISKKLPSFDFNQIYEAYRLAKQDKEQKSKIKLADLEKLIEFFNSELTKLDK